VAFFFTDVDFTIIIHASNLRPRLLQFS
jgi:hypothetical protein